MADNFFKVSKGTTLTPQPSEPTGQNGDIYYNGSSNKFRKFENGAWSDLGGSSSSGRSGEDAITISTTSVVVVFSSPMSDASYVPEVTLINTVDASPSFQTLMVTNKTVNGFTVKWNAPMDSGNYKVGYLVPGVQSQTAEQDISASQTSVTVTIPAAYASTAYVVTASLVNYTDSDPQFQPVTITAKANGTFTAKWNAGTDSGNYKLAFNTSVMV